jgi:hypothetical protein
LLSGETVKEDAKEPGSNSSTSRSRFVLIVLRFLLTWILFLVILAALALLTNINWARSFVQRSLGETLHRKVHLGKLSWTLGLNGIAIGTHEFSVVDKSGQPLVFAGHSEIGIALLPLLNGKLLIRHLDFEKPDIYLLRTAKDHWNIDDLLEYGPDIRFVELDDGTLHIQDKAGSKPQWNTMVLQDVRLKFVWPKPKKKTPFHLSFRMPAKDYETNVQITAIGSGKLKDWRTNEYKLDVKADNFNPRDFQSLYHALKNAPLAGQTAAGQTKSVRKAEGIFDADFSGSGSLDKGIEAKVILTAHDVDIDTKQIGLTAKEATADATINLNEKKINWKDSILKVNDMELKASGEINNWQEDVPNFAINVSGNVADLASIGKLLKQDERTTFESVAIDPKEISGKADLDVSLIGTTDDTRMVTVVHADGVSLREVVKKLPKQSASALTFLGISEDSRVKGELRFVPEESFEIKEGQITCQTGSSSVIDTEGAVNLKDESAKFTIKASNLNCAQIEKSLYQSDDAYKQLTSQIWLPARHALVLGGKIDLDGNFESSKTATISSGTADLRGAQFSLNDKSLATSKMTGRIAWTKDHIELQHVQGAIGVDGKFEMNGRVTTGKSPQSDLDITAQHLDLKQLATLLNVFKVRVPVFCQHELFGRVSDLELTMKGPSSAPNIYFKATPEDLCYQPTGMSKPLRSKAGTIIYDHDKLSLIDVAFVVRNDKVTTSLEIDKLSTAASVNKIKVKTAGVELAEVNYYLSSILMPPPLRKQYLDLLAQYKLSNIHGRTYGDGTCTINGDKVALQGACGLNNVGAKVGDQRFPMEHIGGSLTASGDDLTIDDLSGSIRQSKFILDGKITKYQEPQAVWQADMRASIEPQELPELVPSLTDQVRKWKLSVSAAGSLNIKAKIRGNQNANNITFNMNADPGDHVLISGPFGALHQPAGEPMTLSGVLNADQVGFSAENVHIAFGNSSLIVGGTLKNPPKSRQDKSRKDPDIAQSAINFTISSPSPIPARKLITIIDPSVGKDDISGNIDGQISIGGTVAVPRVNGQVALADLSMPKFDLHDVSGKIEFKEQPAADKLAHRVKVELPSIRLHSLVLRKVIADLNLEAENGSTKAPIVTLSNGHAEAAQGKLLMDGSLDANDQRLKLHATLSKAKAGEIMEHYFGHPDELTGICDAEFDISTKGDDYKECISNLCGTATVTVRSGTVTRFGQLQARVSQANLVHQGLFGFNLNNLLKSVYTVRSGQFKELIGQFHINNGVMNVSQLRYSGEDMRLWGSGKANLPLNTLQLEVAGNIPRTSSSVIGGPVGEVSKAFTLQKVVSTVTLHQLDSLPALPVLGELAASDHPRTFSFRVLAPLDKPKVIAQSIEKSFHWLPVKSAASAHPVPGL